MQEHLRCRDVSITSIYVQSYIGLGPRCNNDCEGDICYSTDTFPSFATNLVSRSKVSSVLKTFFCISMKGMRAWSGSYRNGLSKQSGESAECDCLKRIP